MAVKIDNVTLDSPPSQVALILPDVASYPGQGATKVIVQPIVPDRLEVRWGDEQAAYAAVSELRTKRTNRMNHVFSWSKENGVGFYHRNVVIPYIGYSQGPGGGVDPFTLSLESFKPVPSGTVVELYVPGILGLGDGQARWKTEAGGRILNVHGYIGNNGSISGQTRIQIRNATLSFDYLSTRGDFTFDGTNLMINQVLSTSSPGSGLAAGGFNRGDVIALDIDTVPGGADAANVSVWLTVLLFPV